MKPEASRLWLASLGFALYLGVPVHGVLLPPAEAAMASSPGGGPGGIAKAEGDDESGSGESGSDESGSGESDSDESDSGDSSGDGDEGSSEDDSD